MEPLSRRLGARGRVPRPASLRLRGRGCLVLLALASGAALSAPAPAAALPTVIISSGPSGPTADATPSFEFSADDPLATFECRVDLAAFARCTSPRTVAPLGEGAHVFSVRGVDTLGSPGPAVDRNFEVDTIPPQTVITAGPPTSSSDATPTFAFASDDPGASFECSLDGAPFSSCTSPRTVGPVAVGRHSFAVRSRDRLGNLDQTPAALAFEVVSAAVESPQPSRDEVITSLATTFAGDLARCAGALKAHEIPRLRRRGARVGPVHAATAGTFVLSVARTRPRRSTVLRGSRLFRGPGASRVGLKLRPAGRRLLRRSRALRVTLTMTFTARSGLRITAAERLVLRPEWLTVAEARTAARRAIRRSFGDRPAEVVLQRVRRIGPTRLRSRVEWRNRRVWWYAPVRVRQLHRRFPSWIGDARRR
jgi:hypothetical protein